MTKGMIKKGEFPIKRVPKNISTKYDTKTAQPCQVTGKPHPTPYFFAGNQMSLFVFFMIGSFRPKEK